VRVDASDREPTDEELANGPPAPVMPSDEDDYDFLPADEVDL
jgi:hypothetical protein